MKKKVLAAVLSMSMVAAALAGCGDTDSSQDAAPADTAASEAQTDEAQESAPAQAASDGETVTIRFSWWGGDERNAATQEVIEQFEALHPNVIIEAEYGGNDGYHDKLATALASGTAADIVQVDPEIFPTYVTTGDYFYDYAELGVDMSNFDEAYISLEINGRYDGKQLGLPSGISGAGLLVNKELAEAIGLDFTQPYDWEDLLEMGKKVKEYDPELYLFNTNKEYLVNMVVFNYGKQLAGGTFIDPDSNEIRITQEQLEEVYTYIEALFDEGVIPPASYQASYSGDELQNDTNWIEGKYVANFAYISTMDVMMAANPDAEYYAGQIPMLEGATEAGWASNTPQVFAITKTSEHPEVAAEFMDYFFNNEEALATLGCTRSVPPTEKARQICTENGSLSECVMEGANIASSMGGTPNDKISSTNEAKAILFDAVESIGYGAKDPATAAEETLKLLSGLIE